MTNRGRGSWNQAFDINSRHTRGTIDTPMPPDAETA
jgi:hypothetical protein